MNITIYHYPRENMFDIFTENLRKFNSKKFILDKTFQVNWSGGEKFEQWEHLL